MLGLLATLSDLRPSIQASSGRFPSGRQTRTVTSLRCTLVGRYNGRPLRAEIAQEAGRRRLLRVFEADDRTIRAEFRNWGPKVVIWAPANKLHYLRETVEEPYGYAKPLQRFIERMGLDGLDLDRLFGDDPFFQRRPAFGGETVKTDHLPDGTPVTVISTPRYIYSATGRQGSLVGYTRNYVGTKDGLLRRFEYVGSPNDMRPPLIGWEYRNLRANAPIPTSVFAFRPPKGVQPANAPQGIPPQAFSNNIQFTDLIGSLCDLDSLTFRTESERDVYIHSGTTLRRLSHDATNTDFSWTATDHALGEVRWREAGKPRRLTLMIEGETLSVQRDGEDEPRTAPLGFRGRWTFDPGLVPPERGPGAALLICEIVKRKRTWLGADMEDFVPVLHTGDDEFDLMERIEEPVDVFGIPTGRQTVWRLYVDRLSHMPRLYESISTSDVPGEPSRIVTTERFLGVKPVYQAPHPQSPSRGVLPSSG